MLSPSIPTRGANVEAIGLAMTGAFEALAGRAEARGCCMPEGLLSFASAEAGTPHRPFALCNRRRVAHCDRRELRSGRDSARHPRQVADPRRRTRSSFSRFTSLNGIGEIVLKTGPLLLIAQGLAVGYRANVWNIGAEGQLTSARSPPAPRAHFRVRAIRSSFCRR